MADGRNEGNGVTGVVTGRVEAPLSNAERQRRYRERKAERARAGSGVSGDGSWSPAFPGQRPPFAQANQLAVRHGAFSARLTGPLREQIAAELLADPATPDYVREGYAAAAVAAWAQAEAECRRLRERWGSNRSTPETGNRRRRACGAG